MNADPLARWYRWIEYAAFGHALEQARYAFLGKLSRVKSVLILGEGDGRMLQQLLAMSPDARVDVIESSAAMIALARQRTRSNPRVVFHQMDALTCSWPHGSYDAVVTHFFLDCFTGQELSWVIEAITRRMKPDAIWLIADFAIPQRGWGHWHAAFLVAIMYRFFGTVTGLQNRVLPDITKIMSHLGFQRAASFELRSGLIRSEMWRNIYSESR